jgi:hypothetical protein
MQIQCMLTCCSRCRPLSCTQAAAAGGGGRESVAGVLHRTAAVNLAPGSIIIPRTHAAAT